MVEKNIGLSVVSSHSLSKQTDVFILKVQGLKIKRKMLICSVAQRELTHAAKKFVSILKEIYEGQV